jgi:hypothetical protein
MQAIVVFESMFGATRQVAEAIADGLGGPDVATVVPVRDVTSEMLEGVDVLVVGGPTHVHGMTRPRSRQAASEMAARPDKNLHLEPGATEPGLREWLDEPFGLESAAAAFDTRSTGPKLFTGRASRKIARSLKRHGATLVAKPHSFLIARDELAPGELDEARRWGTELSGTVCDLANVDTNTHQT